MKKHGFSLIEVLVAILLVGLAIAALVVANGSFTKANAAATDLSTAEFLIEQIRERTALLGYDDLEGVTFPLYSPPINANGEVLSNFAAFSQQITVENVSDANFEQVVVDSNFVRVTVKVFLNSKEISSASWLRADIDN
jgi:prepilin-type N-terminal cleavage/methylation domain-containing protein